MRLMSLGWVWKKQLGDEFGGDFDEFDEFGVVFVVCVLSLEMHLMSLGGAFDEFGCGFETRAWR